MSDNTRIEWADATLNYINGCTRVSPGCGGPGDGGGCYAELLAGTRLRSHPTRAGLTRQTPRGPRWTGEVRAHEPALLQALRWKRPRRIFWNAHGDLFHEAVPDAWIDRLFAVCALTPQHTHMILTKRSARMRDYLSTRKAAKPVMVPIGDGTLGQHPFNSEIKPPRNIWLGVSVEDQQRADERVPDLLATPAAVRFLSCEPLLGPVDLEEAWAGENALDNECWGECGWCERGYPPLHNCQAGCQTEADYMKGRSGLDWVIVGGESGPGARPIHPDWARALRDQCQQAGVPFLFKQWGEWAPVCEMGEELIDSIYHPAPETHPEATRRCKVDQCVLHADGRRFDGWAMFERPAFEHGCGAMMMLRVGKRRAGRLLDGRAHDDFPASPRPSREPAPARIDTARTDPANPGSRPAEGASS